MSLADRLRRRIAETGPLTIADFMEAALGDPEAGYYTTRDPLGAAGDFTTAPEISQMFGELLGLWCAECWERLGRPAPVRLVELGPGRGTLMADALRAAEAVAPAFAAAAELHLVETSPALRRAQARTLAVRRPVWHERLAGVPTGPLLVLANEFFDALPVRQFERGETGWRERLVDWDAAAGRFRFARGVPAEAPLPAGVAALPPGSLVEIAPARQAVAAELGGRVASDGGAALIVDYGHAAPAPGDTLQAVRRHAIADPLAAPGEADLTAHVDFAALAAAARGAGAAVAGPVPQGVFLARLGIAVRAARLKRDAAPAQAAAVDAALARLTDPAAMGALFKAMAIVAPGLSPVPGFEAGEIVA